ncbi:hypothetical protein J2W32_000354 [Variovorax boronicumulans]|uniref:Uncharacterized protein n=1 Tax=Variovorax boronicumulans TaxID=436515 RepID=A0AAW8CQM4_9BURK|nr:hypothetical protein [Variovorax boronicumulans]MDP9891257.1 hypothetical protein [Variovorax boronicumulans]MDQ0051325.1 hypothetical protein [Variovorax boronicumulans]
MPSVTITLIDQGQGRVSVRTDALPPKVGLGVSQAQGLAMEFLGTALKRGLEVVYDRNQVPLVSLAVELLDPEGLGFACTAEVRDRARLALGRDAIEHKPTMAGVDIDRVHQHRPAVDGAAA